MSVRPTATLAELYVRQGLVGRARDIYRELAAGNDEAAEQARRRLLELGPSAGNRIEALRGLLERVQQRRTQHAKE
jgi:lipopolysaccharide biosynthesis regulator YciM